MLLSSLFTETHMNRFLVILSAGIFAVSTALPQTAAQFTPDSLTRALWHFNELSGSAVHDTAAGIDGTAYGATIVPGRFGNARSFNGTSDYVIVPSNTAFDFDTSGFSVDVWFKTTQAGGIILRRGLAPDPGFLIGLLDGRIVGMFGNRGDSHWPDELLSDTSAGTYNDNLWHIATLVRDRVARKLLLYVDGVITGNPADDNFTLPLNSDRPLTVGRWESDVYPTYFAGSIDEVRISRSGSTGIPLAISVQPGRLNFGWVRAQTSDTLSLQIGNSGNRDTLRVASLATLSPLFGVPPGSFVIPPGGNRVVPVWYSPGAGKVIGDTSALRVTSNDPVSPQVTILIYGFGYAPNPPTEPFTADSLTRALWHFDESSGTLVHDTAAGNEGSATGTTITPGRFVNARSFNGNGDYVNVPSSTMFDFDSSGFSIDVWFKSAQGGGIILRRGLAPDPGFMISLFQNGRVVGMIGTRSDSPWPDELLSDTSVASYNDNAWHLATMVRDRTARRLFLYVDGVMASPPAVDNFTLPLNSSHPLTIGRWESGFNPSYFSGSVDEVRISSPRVVRWPVRMLVQPLRLDFGLMRISSRDTLGIQVTNAGYRDSLRILSVSSSNARFSVPGGPMVIGRGSNRTIAVVYTPAAQADTGTITITSNDPSSPSVAIVVSGQGFAPVDRPVITSITRVSYNQARIVWERSRYDTLMAADSVTEYSIWHRIFPGGSANPAGGKGQDRPLSPISPGPAWEFIQTVPAIGVDFYGCVVATPVNPPIGTNWEVYMVVAQTRDLVPYLSAPDSIRSMRVTGIDASEAVQGPVELTLKQNYPNPFNPSTVIRYGLPARTNVSLAIYNTLGQTVATLVDGEQESGYHEVRFDGANLASGVYFCRLKAGQSVRTSKLLLLR